MSDEPDLQECVNRLRDVMEHVVNDDEVQQIEVDLQHAAAALGVSPDHIYPDDEPGPDYWYDPENWPNDPWLNGGLDEP